MVEPTVHGNQTLTLHVGLWGLGREAGWEGNGLREGDLLLSARTRETGRLVYILVEHQSRSDRFMAFRLLRYVVRIWELLLEEDPELDHLPMVIPVVLHHGRPPYPDHALEPLRFLSRGR